MMFSAVRVLGQRISGPATDTVGRALTEPAELGQYDRAKRNPALPGGASESIKLLCASRVAARYGR